MSGVEFAKGHPPLRRGLGRGAAAKIAIRDEGGRFQRLPRRDLQIILFSGGVRGGTRILSENARAVRTGIEKGLVLSMNEMIPTVAKRTGKMRSILQTAAQAVASAQTNVIGDKIVIDMNDIKAMATAIEKYIEYHTDPGSDFPSGYQDPTTPGTVPFDLGILQSRTIINVRRQIFLAQKQMGLAVR